MRLKLWAMAVLKKIESEILVIQENSKKKIAQRTRKDTGQLKACSSTLTERMLCRSSKNLRPPIISCNTSFYDNNPIRGILTL
jgi:hypothetical protein